MPLEICRVCGDKNNLKYLIFPGNENLLEILRVCANIVIAEKDVLPKYICDSCEQGLKFSYRLRKIGEETDRKLREELIVVEQEQADADTEDAKELDEKIDDDELFFEDVEEICDEYETFYDDGLKIEKYEVEEQDVPAQQDDAVQRDDDADCEEVYAEDFDEDTEDGNDFGETGDSDLQCNMCDEICSDKKTFSAHLKTHEKQRFFCALCDKSFDARYRLHAHIQTHSGRTFQCTMPLCNKEYTNQGNWARHIQTAHSKEKRFQCAVCEKTFARADIFKRHATKHSDDRDFECDLCHKRFKSKHYLNSHKEVHKKNRQIPAETKKKKKENPPDGIQPTAVFTCEYCERIFNHRSSHTRHVRIHTGERPYACSSCEKTFRTISALKTHSLLHTDERPFKCDQCTLSFRQQGHLSSHLFTHNGVKPHHCKYCDKSFTVKSNLKVHERIHTGEQELNKFKRHENLHEGDDNSQQEEEEDGIIGSESMRNIIIEDEFNLYIHDIIEIGNEGDPVQNIEGDVDDFAEGSLLQTNLDA